jgi:hypothetical protein
LIAVTNSQILPLSITAYGYGIKMAAMQDSITHKHILKVICSTISQRGKENLPLPGMAQNLALYFVYIQDKVNITEQQK